MQDDIDTAKLSLVSERVFAESNLFVSEFTKIILRSCNIDPRTATRYFYFRMRRYVYGKLMNLSYWVILGKS